MNPTTSQDDESPAEFDFSGGVRGKFHRSNALLRMPVYLDDEVQSFLAERALAKGVEVAVLVNSLLRKDIELIEAATEAAAK